MQRDVVRMGQRQIGGGHGTLPGSGIVLAPCLDETTITARSGVRFNGGRGKPRLFPDDLVAQLSRILRRHSASETTNKRREALTRHATRSSVTAPTACRRRRRV